MSSNSDELENLKAEWLAEAEATANLEGELPTAPNLPEDTIPIPLATEVHQVARECAAQQRTPEKAEQVRRNLLAVLSVWNYLRLQGYGLELEASDCWNPILRQMNDVADLVVSGIGRLECRVFEAEQELCLLPEEVQVDRRGYVGGQFDAEERWAWLVGFAPALSTMEPVEGIRRAELYSMDEFAAHLHGLRLFQEILSEKTNELWKPELRNEIVAQLERVILLEDDPYRYSEFANREIAPLIGRKAMESGQLVGQSRESRSEVDQEAGGGANLGQFLQEIFDEFDDRLGKE